MQTRPSNQFCLARITPQHLLEAGAHSQQGKQATQRGQHIRTCTPSIYGTRHGVRRLDTSGLREERTEVWQTAKLWGNACPNKARRRTQCSSGSGYDMHGRWTHRRRSVNAGVCSSLALGEDTGQIRCLPGQGGSDYTRVHPQGPCCAHQQGQRGKRRSDEIVLANPTYSMALITAHSSHFTLSP